MNTMIKEWRIQMYVRLSFQAGQKININELRELEDTLSDSIEFTKLYIKEGNRIDQLYGYLETTNPDDPDLKREKPKTLVYESDMVQLDTTKEYICDLDLFLNAHPNIKVSFRGLPKTVEKNYTSLIDNIVQIQGKLETALAKFDKSIQFNEKCDVHVGGFALMSINQLGWAENYCTEALQEILNRGWHILAVCVQPDGRRPDYILGRHNPDESVFDCIKF